MKRILILSVLGVVVVAGVVAVMRAALDPSEHTVGKVTTGRAMQTVYATGFVEARERRVLRAPRAAVIEHVYPRADGAPLREGDEVRRGQPILRLRDSARDARRMAARAELERVSDQLKEGSPFRRALELNIAESEQSALDLRAREQRLAAQLGSGGISRDSYDQARTSAIIAEERNKALRQDYLQQIANLEAARQSATASLQQLEAAERDDLIVAPLDGVLLRLPLKEGEFAPSGAELAMVGDIRELIIEAEVNEDDIANTRPGSRVIVRLAGHDDRAVDGRVFEVLPDADRATKGYLVKVGFEGAVFAPEPGSQLRGRTVLARDAAPFSGMTAELGIVVAERAEAVIFPRAALTPDNTVFLLLDGNRVEERAVTLGLANFNVCEAVSGLSEGDRVVTSDIRGLSSGQRIRVKERP